MKTYRSLTIVLLPVVALATSFWFVQGRRAPGAGEVIDASQYPNLQAALDAVPERGGVVRLPPGQFELTQPLLLSRSDTRIEGSGAATHLINRNEEGQPALVVRHPANDAKTEGAGRQRQELWRVQLADFRISGNPKSGDGLIAHRVNEIFVHGLSVDHNGGHGINLQFCYEDPRIADSILTYNGKAGLNIQGGHDIVVNANQFEENQDAVRTIDSFNLCMNGNNIDDHLRHGIVIENTYGSVLSGNMIEECRGTAIILDRDCYGITIGSNVIAHNLGGGVDLRDAWGSSVSANTFTIVPKPAVLIGPNSGRISVAGNAFSNSYVGGRTVREEDYTAERPGSGYSTGIVLNGTMDIAISGNVFTGLIEESVKMEGHCRRIALVGNVSADLGRKQSGKAAAFHLGSASEVVQGLNVFEKGFEPQ